MLVNMTGGKKVTVVENVEPDLLWTNASPTSAFGPQAISVNGAEYDAYLVEFRRAYNEPIDLGYGFVKKNALMSCCGARSMEVVGGSYQYGWREIQGATDTTVVFGRGYSTKYDTLSTSANNSYGIPTRIWGVKFTL